ncbi:hypothetical protein Q2E61_13770 [Microbulbifer thermotolerans]|uniref:hypothetical protein n=1 Tax=Microbulbifer thermotolerans TaxID=252514 RepID=UPI002671117D|nr:hypothetical protein [Microbulbifer thermotolerans]WKT59962.1 hypothetical protein Q2E61_13770 [Microbulbifer thermotolerans]
MPKLKNSIINDIYKYLEFDDFCLEDFDVKFPENSDSLTEITFIALPKYSFVLDETYTGDAIGAALALSGESRKRIIRTIEAPGDYKNSEVHMHEQIDSAIERIAGWVRNVREDLVHSKSALRVPDIDLINDLESSFEKEVPDPEAFFGEDEEKEISRKIDELSRRVSELEEKLSISPEESKIIENVLVKSKENLKKYPKGVVFRILCHFFTINKKEMTYDQTYLRYGCRHQGTA